MNTNTPTMEKTLKNIRETQEVTDHIWQAVATGEITEAQAVELIGEVLK